jgi:hypothetical protein
VRAQADHQELLAKLSLEEKISLLTGADFWSLHGHSRIGLRPIRTSDGPAGVRGPRWDERDTALNVPAPVALTATWDPERAELMGSLLAAECRRKGVDVLLAPTVNLQRSPFGGRNFEFFGEDPVLAAAMGGALVRGLQRGGVAATVKHFVANDSETERFTVDIRVAQRVLRELYLAPFESIVRQARRPARHHAGQRRADLHRGTPHRLPAIRPGWARTPATHSGTDWATPAGNTSPPTSQRRRQLAARRGMSSFGSGSGTPGRQTGARRSRSTRLARTAPSNGRCDGWSGSLRSKRSREPR